MRFLPQLFDNNRAWARRQVEREPDFFSRLGQGQDPDFLWIGCSDSRVPANIIVGLPPGDVFVHRNVGNLVPDDDRNSQSVLQYAVDRLRVRHIILCGHERCGGVLAALGEVQPEPLEGWVSGIRRVADAHRAELDTLPALESRWRRLCELNVEAQVAALRRNRILCAAWGRGQALVVHGWIFDVESGLLRDLGVSADRPLDDAGG